MSEKTPVTGIATFGGSSTANGLILAEIDTIMHLDSEGKPRSNFLPGEPVYFILHYAPTVTIVRVLDTDDGDIQLIGPVRRDKVELLSFDYPGHELELSHLPAGALSKKWYGRQSDLKVTGKTIIAANAPCLGEISYTFAAMQYLHKPAGGLTLLPGENFPVDIKVEYTVDE